MFSAMPELLTLTMEFSVERFSQACEPNLKGLYSCVVVLCYIWIAMEFFSVHYGCIPALYLSSRSLMGARQLRQEVKQLGRWKRKHERKKSSLPIPKEIEFGGKKEKKRKLSIPIAKERVWREKGKRKIVHLFQRRKKLEGK